MHGSALANENLVKVLAATNYQYEFVFARNAGHCDRASRCRRSSGDTLRP
jgi:iron(III)-enterobactin esterase